MICCLLLKEREEEQKRLKLQKLNEEAEQKRLAAELEERRKQRILREIEERELEEAQALLEDTEKRMKKGKKKPLLDGVSLLIQNVSSCSTLFYRSNALLKLNVGEGDKAICDGEGLN